MLIQCYFDGSCEPYNPGGRMGYGYVILKDNKIFEKWSGKTRENVDNSNNVAEYLALYNLLLRLIDLKLNDDVIFIKGDSSLVINQMTCKWKVKSGRYLKTARSCGLLLPKFKLLHFCWVPRQENEIADKLSR